MNNKMDYISNIDTIIFAHYFNKKLDSDLLSIYKKIIFSNYELYDDLFDIFLNNNLSNLNYYGSQIQSNYK